MRNPYFLIAAVLLFSLSAVPGHAWPLKAPEKYDRVWEDPEWARERNMKASARGSMRRFSEMPAGPLSLLQVINVALRNNPATRQAWREARAAYANEKQAESAWFPELSFSASTSHTRTYTNNNFSAANTRTDGFQADVKFLVLDFGGRAATVKEAKEMLLASNYGFNQTFQDLMLKAEKAYYGLYASMSRIEAAEADVADNAKALEAARRKFDAGLVAKLDVLQAESEYSRSLYQLEGARRDGKDAEAGLCAVMGLPAGIPVSVFPPWSEKPEEIIAGDVRELIEEAIAQRPDVASARASLESKKAALQAANSDLWPTLNAGGTVSGNRYYHYGSEKDNIFNPGSDYGYTAYVSIDWKIFDGFYLYSARNEAREDFRAEAEKLRKIELDACADVWSKYYAYTTALKQYDYGADFLSSAEASYELAFMSYENGLKDIIDLLKSSADLSEARSNMVSSRENLFVAFAELVHAMGMLYVAEE